MLAMSPGVLANAGREVQSPATSAELRTQAAEPIPVKEIEVRSTQASLQINLQTDGTALPAPSTETVGNATILEIPNAILALPNGEDYFAANPAEGIALITATMLDG
jgi:iron complex outermembrane receptor protein